MKCSAWLAVGLVLGAGGLRAQQYPVPSFDCANVTMPLELQICRSSELSELDGLHGYLAARAIQASSRREEARSDVEAWLDHVRNECQTDKCLADAYTARIAELERKVAQLAPVAPPRILAPPPWPAAPAAQPVMPMAPPVVSVKPEVAPPVPAAKGPPPEPQSEDEEDDDDDSRPWYLVAGAIGALAVAIAAVMRSAKGGTN
jgi:hypothetical protein